MALNISTNVPSLNAQRHLESSSNNLNRSLERLASGLRINSAADDAAGLAIADRLRADVRIATQAVRNANDGISAISIGEKALGKSGEILARLSELASQSATGTVSDSQRSALQEEFTALVSEIDRISNTTTFNSVNLLSAGTTVALQIGLDGSSQQPHLLHHRRRLVERHRSQQRRHLDGGSSAVRPRGHLLGDRDRREPPWLARLDREPAQHRDRQPPGRA